MYENNIEYYRSKFEQYTQNFTAENNSQNIKLKLRHSYAVCENMEKLSTALGLSQEDKRLAQIIGLFHDIARFIQYHEYGTFRDDLSFNHAQKGVQIIKNKKLLKHEDKTSKELIKAAIQHHNKESIPAEHLDKRTLKFCRLIRDADKLDIYETLVNYHLEQRQNGKTNVAIELDLPENDRVHPGAIEDIMAGRIVSSEHIQSLNDLVLLQMGWVFDINFQPTMEIINNRDYILQLAEVLPNRKNIQQAVAILEQKIESAVNAKV